jgi:hypothetical protein
MDVNNMQTEAATKLYVAPAGDDAAPGTIDEPLATMFGARNRLRKLRYDGEVNGAAEINLRQGAHVLSEPLQLTAGDSGSSGAPVVYRSYPGEQATITSGRRITNWQPHTDGIFVADIPDVRNGLWSFKQLFCGGKRMIRSRRPKYNPDDPLYDGWAFIDELVDTSGALDGVDVCRLGPWRFRTDPDSVGQRQQWASAATGTGDWADIGLQTDWVRQGYEYLGTAWYRTTVTVTADFDSRENLWLCFGAVDKEAYVYLDGELIFEHSYASTGLSGDELWDRPFKMDIRGHLKAGQTHELAVRINCDSGGGGMRHPVSLVSADGEPDLISVRGSVRSPAAFTWQDDPFPAEYAKAHQSEVFVVPGKSWVSDMIPVRAVDAATRTIYLRRPVGMSAHTLGSATHLMPGNRFRIENNLEDLTDAGEWCLDAEAGKVYFRPPSGIDIERAVVTAPQLEGLVELRGGPETGAFVSFVRFENLRLTQNQIGWPKPDSYYKTPNASVAFLFEYTDNCAITDCEFDAVGGDAIRISGMNNCVTAMRNHIHGAGAYGIFIAHKQTGFSRHDVCSSDLPGPSEWHMMPEDRAAAVAVWPRSLGHVISDNHIHHFGVYEKHANGVAFFGVATADVTVSHNHIHHGPRFGIGLMSGLGPLVIEYNDLHDLCLETCDAGGITANRWYTTDLDPQLTSGAVIRYNRVVDIVGCGAYGIKAEPGGIDYCDGRLWTHYYSWGIYFDNAPMNIQVYGNVVARNTLGGMMISWYCHNTVVENNIFVDSSKSQVYLLLGGEMSGQRFCRNIITYTAEDADYMRLNAIGKFDIAPVFDELNANLIMTPGGAATTFSGVPGEAIERMGEASRIDDPSMSWWHSLGFDTTTVYADPKFVDPDNDDYTLAPDSPAFDIGFEPIDTSQIGIRPTQ